MLDGSKVTSNDVLFHFENSWFVVSIPKNLTHWTPQLPISEQRHGNKNNMVDITDQILICFWGSQSCGYKLHNMYATIP